MNTSIPNNDIPRLLRNLIRIGTVAEVDLFAGTCRVNTGGNVTDWLHWLTSRAGRSRSWWAPSAGEQVLLFCLGGELDTAFVMPGVFSDEFPAPAAPADLLAKVQATLNDENVRPVADCVYALRSRSPRRRYLSEPAGSNGWRKSGGRKSGSVKPGGIKIEVSDCFKCNLLI